MNTKRQSRHWIEGLDWIRVTDILDLADGDDPEVGERIYTTLLKKMISYLPDVNEDQFHTLMAEAKRRAEAREMSKQQATCFGKALRETGEDIDKIQKLVNRLRFRVVK